MKTAGNRRSPTSQDLLSLFLREWQAVFSIVGKLSELIRSNQPQGLFEVVDFDTTLDLKDGKGHKAEFHRHMKVRFLQDHTIGFQDHCWGDGDVLATYKISPGIVVDKYQEAGRWNILVSLRQTKNRDDTEDFYIDRTVIDGFTHDTEWLQVEVWMPIRHLRMAVQFPKHRSCTRAWLHRRSNDRVTELGNEHYHRLADGRQLIAWEHNSPKRGEVYTLHWEW